MGSSIFFDQEFGLDLLLQLVTEFIRGLEGTMLTNKINENRYTEKVIEPFLLGFGVIAAAGHGPGVTAGPGQLLFPASGHTNHHGFVKGKTSLHDPLQGLFLKATTRLHVQGNGQTGITMQAIESCRILHCQSLIEDCIIVDNDKPVL